MPVRIVQSKQNARLKELRRALAQPGRSETGLVGIEGPNLLQEAIRAAVRVECVFVPEDLLHSLTQLDVADSTDILVLPRDLLFSVLATETPQPIAALVEPPKWTWTNLFNHNRRAALIIVLAELQDPGNLGTILRSAEAFGATGIISLTGTVSEWNPKAVRASAGSVFRIPVVHASPEDAIQHLREAGVRMLATAVTAAKPANLIDLAAPVALIIGNEGNGVPAELAAKTEGAITVPCPGPVESLNAAVAASVLLYEASRQRAMRHGGPSNHEGSPR